MKKLEGSVVDIVKDVFVVVVFVGKQNLVIFCIYILFIRKFKKIKFIKNLQNYLN